MAGKEAMDPSKWVLRPCTAAKSEKDTAAGDVDSVVQCPTKSKAVAGSSYKEGDRPPEGWIDVYALSEPASFDPFGSHSRAAAMDKLLQDAVLPVAVKQAPAAGGGAGGGKLKRRLTKDEIMSIIALKPEPFPSADYLDELAQFEPPESIEEKRRQHEEDAAYFGDRDLECEAFRQQVIKGLKENGYYEVDGDYVAARGKANQRAVKDDWNPFGFLDPSELQGRFATPEDHQRRLQQGCYRRYVPDAEDALLISYGEEDDCSVSDEDGDTEAQGHKGTPIEAN